MKKRSYLIIAFIAGIFSVHAGTCTENHACAKNLETTLTGQHVPKEEKGLQSFETIELSDDCENDNPHNALPGLKTEEPKLKMLVQSEKATGDWLGIRPKLEDNGLELNFRYTNDTLLKGRGGSDPKSRIKSISLLNMEFSLDTEKAHLWKGGQFYVLGQNIHGKGATDKYIGDIQNISSIDAPRKTQLSEYWYQQELFDEKIVVKLGKQDASGDFGFLESCQDLLNASFTLMPNIPIPAYPDQGLGVASFVNPYEWLSLKTGVYDGKARGSQTGFNTAFGGDNKTVIISEISLKPNIKNHEGNYLFGFWQHNGDFDEILANDPPDVFTGSNGFYTSFEQFIFKRKSELETDKGLRLFGQFAWAPSDRSDIARYYGLGLHYKGLIKARSDDITAIGANLCHLSKRYRQLESRKREGVLEFFHKFQLNQWLAIQPSLQLVIQPNGQYPSVVVLGIRSIIDF